MFGTFFMPTKFVLSDAINALISCCTETFAIDAGHLISTTVLTPLISRIPSGDAPRTPVLCRKIPLLAT